MVGHHHWKATPGEPGLGKKKSGADGKDLIIRVPPGTLLYDKTSGLLISDLKEAGQLVRIAKGGKGGKGNINFVNSVRQAPDFAEPGQKGQIREVHLELRLIADVGIIGLPNAGKSTLLSRFTHAKPKIADYPFTTLSPQLGIAELDAERRLVLADIPGLIEGAHEGAGLGLDFLRHIERTRVLVHMIDIMPIDGTNPIDSYHQIRKELEAYSPKLAAKPEFLVANKMDLSGASESLADLRSALPGKQIFAISAVAGTGLRPLLESLWLKVQAAPASNPLIDDRPYIPPAPKKTRPEDEMFQYIEGDADEKTLGSHIAGEDGPLPNPNAAASSAAPRRRTPQPRTKPTRRKSAAKRTLIEPVKPKVRGKGGERITAKERKAAHDLRIKKKLAPAVPEPETPAPAGGRRPARRRNRSHESRRRAHQSYNRRKTDV